jgi:putative hydrolase
VGHAEVVMDDVGPAIVPSVHYIRAKVQRRREEVPGVDKVLRRLLGLEAKMRQYRDGAVFVRAVTALVGIDGFNAVWTSPQTLPLPDEIQNPAIWVKRVHG